MQENAKLLMEETGCEQGEAELALELANNDLEKAIRTIGSLLRHIRALKGKFCFPEKNLYGLLLIIVNTKTSEILRLNTVISYNPSLYENSVEMDWYGLEKLIFSYRLDDGSLPDFTQGIEEKLKSFLIAQQSVLVKCDTVEISDLLAEFFYPEKVVIKLLAEELNLTQFRQMPSDDPVHDQKAPEKTKEQSTVWLQVELIESEAGKEAGKLAEGDGVMSIISDTRDIAHYLAHLIGGKSDGNMVPLPAMIKSVTNTADECEVKIYYAPGIGGVAKVKAETMISMVEGKAQPWWKKIIPWNN